MLTVPINSQSVDCQFFLIPTKDCQGTCAYCFNRSTSSQIMTDEVLNESIAYMKRVTEELKMEKVPICFHGGEPLLAGEDFLRKAWQLIRESFGARARLSIQSNLFEVSDSLCLLFRDYGVSVGTSLDGTERINDRNRGKGSFRKTMRGINLLRSAGIPVDCIATMTFLSNEDVEEIFEFFFTENLHMCLHPACKAYGSPTKDSFTIEPEDYKRQLLKIWDLYLSSDKRVRIRVLDAMARAIGHRNSGLCTFNECTGYYLAIDPSGLIYPCNRFVGVPEFAAGHVQYTRTWTELWETEPFKMLLKWASNQISGCGNCIDFELCHGGCPYHALSVDPSGNSPDPYCHAYRAIYQRITDDAIYEMLSKENIAHACNTDSFSRDSLFRRTDLLRMLAGIDDRETGAP